MLFSIFSFPMYYFIYFFVNKGLTITKPIVYGNFARYFGKKREEDGHTHEWTVYVKPFNNEDMSTYVKKVFIDCFSIKFNL